VVIGSTARQPKMTVLATWHGNAFMSRSRPPSRSSTVRPRSRRTPEC
jgi:hypothetical protein